MNTGPEDAIRVDALEWHTQIPVDPRHGQPTGMWQPGHVTTTMWFDRTLPLILEVACRGERFSRWDLYAQAWRNGGYGLVTEMRLQLHGAVITGIKIILPNCQDQTLSELEARAEVTFSYAGFTVEHLMGCTIGSGGKEHRGALADAYVRSVTFFQRVFSGE